MSDSYSINGVKITHLGGGVYQLEHSSLDGPVKERGKEHAEDRALKIAADAAAQDDGGSMEPQGNMDTTKATQTDAGHDDAEQIAQLKAQVAEANARADHAEKTLETVTVAVNEDAPKPEPKSKIPAGIPRAYTGVMDDKRKAELKRLGIETTTIVLEENSDIPPTGLFLGHNGRGYMIKPGEEVTVPNFLLGVLDDAVMATPLVDSKTQKVIDYRSRRRYSYRVV